VSVVEILKSKLEDLLKELPEKVDIEDVMYRIFLLEKIEAGEKDIEEGRTFTHREAMERLSRRWQN
jgi:predicted transcriptional regulator